MHNPWEEFFKKTVFMFALCVFVSSTETFRKITNLFEENQKFIQEVRSEYNKMGSSAKTELSKTEVKSNTR